MRSWLVNHGEQRGWPWCTRAGTAYACSVTILEGNSWGMSRRSGREVIYWLAVGTHASTYLPMCICRVQGYIF